MTEVLAALLLGALSPTAGDDPVTPDELVRVAPAEVQAAVREEHGPGFRQFDTDHFRMVSDTSPRYHRVVAAMLEQFYREVHPRFFEKEMEPLQAFLIHGGEDFAEFVRRRGFPQNATSFGFYTGSPRALYARRYFPDGSASGVGTLFHEAVHAMVHADMGDAVPAWFNEGFASLFERGRIVRGRWVYGNPNPWREDQYEQPFLAGEVPTLEAYVALDDRAFYAGGNLHYNTGRSLCLYLLRLGEEKLARYVREVREHKGGTRALIKASGRPLRGVEKAWRESVETVNLGGAVAFRSNDPEVLREAAQRYPHYGLLHFILAGVLERTDPAQAIRHAETALADPHFIFPQGAYGVIGRAHWTRNREAAIAAFEKALEYQPWLEQVLDSDHTNLARLLEADGRPEEAAAVRRRLEALQNDDT